jgi:hypothetical protein
VIEPFRESPHRGKPLQLTLRGLCSWRIIYRIRRDRIEIVHTTTDHRREVYTRLRSLLR